MEPEKGPLEKETHLSTNHQFLGSMLVFGDVLLLMVQKSQTTTKDDDSSIIHKVLNIRGGCLGFLNHQQYHLELPFLMCKKLTHGYLTSM